MTTATVWIVDDEPAICWALRKAFESEGYRVNVFSSAELFGRELKARRDVPDVIFLDVRLPGASGIATLNQLRQAQVEIPVVVMTAFGDLKTAVEAVQGQAFEYLTKPFALEEALNAAKRAIRGRHEPPPAVADNLTATEPQAGLLGMSPKMQELYKRIAMAATGDWPVLIVGDQGVGKGSVCRLIHAFSARQQQPLLTFRPNPQDPLECQCELFGYQSDAPAESTSRQWATNRSGLLQLGGGGTVVIDEVLLTPLNLQIRLLEAYESKTWLPVGGSNPHELTARLLFTSTSSLPPDLDEAEIYPQLRAQLLLNVIEIPALSEHPEDIPFLAVSFLQQLAPHGVLKITTAALHALQVRGWPGNLRELHQTLQAAAQRCKGNLIQVEDLAFHSAPSGCQDAKKSSASDIDRAVRQWVFDSCQQLPHHESRVLDSFLYEECLQVVERALFEAVLMATDGNRAKSADILGIHRTTLRQKSKRLGID